MRSPNNSNPKQPRQRLPVNLYLLFVFVLTMLLGTVSFASYIAGTSGDAGVKVAGVELITDASTYGNPADGNLGIHTGFGENEASYTFSVSNGDSEVSLEYQITLTLPSAAPDGLTFALKYGDQECVVESTDNTTFVFDGARDFSPGQTETHQYTLIITADPEKVVKSELDNIALSVTATQMD